MRLLTGKHRVEWENLLVKQARDEARCEALSDAIDKAAQEIKRLLAELDRERQRAENAVDSLLAMPRVFGAPPISVPPQPPQEPDPLAEDPDEVARIEKDMLERGPAALLAKG